MMPRFTRNRLLVRLLHRTTNESERGFMVAEFALSSKLVMDQYKVDFK